MADEHGDHDDAETPGHAEEPHEDHGEQHEHGHGEQRPYDPTHKVLPSREPPLRSTAPQSGYTMRDVGIGVAVLVVGVAVIFGVPLALV